MPDRPAIPAEIAGEVFVVRDGLAYFAGLPAAILYATASLDEVLGVGGAYHA
jgi:hypothetical protein